MSESERGSNEINSLKIRTLSPNFARDLCLLEPARSLAPQVEDARLENPDFENPSSRLSFLRRLAAPVERAQWLRARPRGNPQASRTASHQGEGRSESRKLPPNCRKPTASPATSRSDGRLAMTTRRSLNRFSDSEPPTTLVSQARRHLYGSHCPPWHKKTVGPRTVHTNPPSAASRRHTRDRKSVV